MVKLDLSKESAVVFDLITAHAHLSAHWVLFVLFILYELTVLGQSCGEVS